MSNATLEALFPKTGPCSLCGARYEDYGHNPEPLRKLTERCCEECNETRVIPARRARLGF
jgi:hypothetical protein